MRKIIKSILIFFVLLIIVLFIGIITRQSYCWGNGFSGDSYTIFYNKIFLFLADTDIGIADWAIGYKHNKDNRLILNAVYHRCSEFELFPFPREFYIVRWGKRKYLIESERLISFCNKVNQGYEPRHNFGHFLLRDGDENIVVTGKPNVPMIYKKYLLNEHITEQVEDYFDSLNIVLSNKNKTNLFVGLELFHKNPFYSCFITQIDSSRIIAVVDTNFKSNVKVNDTLSTELPFEISEDFR